MIWNDEKIVLWGRDGGGVTPFTEDNVNPASIDLSWSGRWRKAQKGGSFFDGVNLQFREDGWSEVFDTDWLYLEPGSFYLLDTLEYVNMPTDAVGKLFLKSSAGREGIEHLHAGYIDPDFSGTISLEVEVRVPWCVRIERGQRLVQLTLEQMIARPLVSYKEKGRYNGQNAPTPSKGLPK